MNIKKTRQIILSIAVIALCTTFAFAQKKAVGTSKVTLVNQLITHTSAGYPSALFGQVMEQAKDKSLEAFKDSVIQGLTEKIEKEEKFTSEQKTKLKNGIPEFSDKISAKFFGEMEKSFKINEWIKDSMTQEYSKFTVAELNKLVTFFKTPGGKSFIALMRKTTENSVNGIEAEPNVDTRYVLQIEKFLKSPLGEKFYESFIKKITDSVQAKCIKWSDNFINDLDKDEFMGMIDNFMAQPIN